MDDINKHDSPISPKSRISGKLGGKAPGGKGGSATKAADIKITIAGGGGAGKAPVSGGRAPGGRAAGGSGTTCRIGGSG